MSDVSALEAVVKKFIIPDEEVTHLPELKRSTVLFKQGQPADSLYFLESGLVKLTRKNTAEGRIILMIRGRGELLGEESLGRENELLTSEAEVISAASAYRIPKLALYRLVSTQPELCSEMLAYLVDNRNTLAEKVELLCLHDVEYRILHYVGKLCTIASDPAPGADYQIPVTQLELADLIGATRETTSTVLNQLERRGLLKLSRRMISIGSLEALRHGLNRVTEIPPMHSPELSDTALTQ